MNKIKVSEIMSPYNMKQRRKIEDFLISEIDEDNLQETIDFVRSSEKEKLENYKDFLYDGREYNGLFMEGNQYLISSSSNEVLLIDAISEEHGVDKAYTKITIPIVDFIGLISNKKKC